MSCDEWMRTIYYICDLCGRSKPSHDETKCWCRNKIVRKRIACGQDRAEDVCADFETKMVER